MNDIVEIEQESKTIEEIRKSKFIAHSFVVHNLFDVNKKLEDLSNKYPDATHICYAYNIIDDGVSEKCSDDGEPAGTAGKPILDVIKKQQLNNVLVVVVR